MGAVKQTQPVRYGTATNAAAARQLLWLHYCSHLCCTQLRMRGRLHHATGSPHSRQNDWVIQKHAACSMWGTMCMPQRLQGTHASWHTPRQMYMYRRLRYTHTVHNPEAVESCTAVSLSSDASSLCMHVRWPGPMVMSHNQNQCCLKSLARQPRAMATSQHKPTPLIHAGMHAC